MNTKQQEFDAVCVHLMKQGIAAMNGVDCMYRGDNGTMCAVGCRIPDSAYTPDMEGKNAHTVSRMESVPPELPTYVDMFADLQRVHDQHMPKAEDSEEEKTAGLRRAAHRLANVAVLHDLSLHPSVLQHLI